MSNAKHVVIIGPAHPLRGGLATFNERLARQFLSEGYKVTVYTFSLQYPSFLFPGKTQYSESPAPSDLNIKVCINTVNPFNWLKIGRELKKLKPDYILVRYWLPFMGPSLGTILRIVRKNNHTVINCLADNIIPHEKRPGDKPFTSYFLKPIQRIITMSDKVADDLKFFNFKGPVHTITHPLYDNFGEKLPLNEARQHLNLHTDSFLFLFFGFIRKYKGLDLLIEAMNLLKEKGIACKALVAGEFYEDETPYLEAIKTHRLEEAVLLHTHFIKDEEVRYYFSAVQAVVQPYKNATQSGVTPLAYHFEVPMVVTNVGNLPVMVPENIGLTAEPDPQHFAKAMEKMIHADRENFSKNIATEKLKYSWDKLTAIISSSL